MVLNAAMLESDLAYMVADLPAAITISGKSYTGTAGEMTKTKSVIMEGVSLDYDAEFVVAKSVLPTVNANTACILRGSPMRISRVAESPDGIAWHLYLERQ